MTFNYDKIKTIFKDNEGLLRNEKPDLNLFFKDIEDNLKPMIYQFMVEELKVNPLEFMKFIPNNLFTHTDITDIVLPDNITFIGDDAFYGSSISSISMPGVTKIGNGAFSNCYKLVNIEGTENLQQIGDQAFLNCEELTLLKFSNNIKSFGENAFAGCKKLTIDIPRDALTAIQKADEEKEKKGEKGVQLTSPIFAMPRDEDFKNGRLLIDGSPLEELYIGDGEESLEEPVENNEESAEELEKETETEE